MRRDMVGAVIVAGFASWAGAQTTAAPDPAAPSQAWQKEPDSYRGVKWGAAPAEAVDKMTGSAGVLEEARRAGGGRCICTFDERGSMCDASSKKPVTTRVCFSELELGSMSIQEQWHFSGERYAGTALTFDADDFEKMRDIFVERYGPPTETKDEPFQTRGGLKETNQRLIWKGNAVTVTLQRFEGKITTGGGGVMTNAWFEERAREAEAEKREGAKVF